MCGKCRKGFCSSSAVVNLRVFLLILFLCCRCFVVGFGEITEKVEDLGNKTKKRRYSRTTYPHKRMLGLKPLFKDFVPEPERGRGILFHCKVCKREVAMGSPGYSDFVRYFVSNGHSYEDVTYRVHMGISVLKRLMDSMTLPES